MEVIEKQNQRKRNINQLFTKLRHLSHIVRLKNNQMPEKLSYEIQHYMPKKKTQQYAGCNRYALFFIT